MHAYRAPSRGGSEGLAAGSAPPRQPSPSPAHADQEDDHHAALLPQADGDDDSDDEHGGGFTYSSQPLRSAPSRGRDPTEEQSRLVFDGDAELRQIEDQAGERGVPQGEGVLVPYAHRDIKPALVALRLPCDVSDLLMSRNVMYADDGVTPILMDCE
jgi:hypothetical protein